MEDAANGRDREDKLMRYLHPDPIDHWSLAADNVPMMPKEGEPGTSQPILDVAAVQAKAREIFQYGEDKLMRSPPPDERPLTVGFTREEGEAVLREFYRRYNAEVCGTCLGTGWKDQRQRSLPPIPCPDCDPGAFAAYMAASLRVTA